MSACYEYLLIISPVGIYVFLESKHAHEYEILWSSPEWAVATIFLLFQAVALYRREMNKAGRRLSETVMGFFLLIAVLVTIVASINAFDSLTLNTPGAVALRIGLLVVTSVAFILLVSSSAFVHLMKE